MKKVRVTAESLCRDIDGLTKGKAFRYVNPANKGRIQIVSVTKPEGPIVINQKSAPRSDWKRKTIGTAMLWRMANALTSGQPVNVDRVVGGSYNTRSVLETLLALTPHIYTCRPGRWDIQGSGINLKKGHKHILYDFKSTHQLGKPFERKLGENAAVSEIPTFDIYYDISPSPDRIKKMEKGETIETLRRHSQIQVALAEIGYALGLKSWIAIEDQKLKYQGKKLIEHEFALKTLDEILYHEHDKIEIGKHIDCMMFNGGLQFAFEIEQTTGVTSGLDRLLRFKQTLPNLVSKYVIVADDSLRGEVLRKAQPKQFKKLNPLFLPYSTVEDLCSFIRRHSPLSVKGIEYDDFLCSFMEPCLTP